jgi:HK97 family phage major capsid protein
MTLLEDLRSRRQGIWTRAKTIADIAAHENRSFDADEQAEFTRLNADLETLDERIGEMLEQDRRDGRAATVRRGRPVLSRADQEVARAFRSAIFSKNPAPIEVYSDLPDEWPDDLPEARSRVGPIQVHSRFRDYEQRDTLKSTATQALSTDVYSTIVQHLVETSSLMAAGATVVTTATGEDLIIPKSTGFVSSAIIGEGVLITESDPTLSTVTLKAFKYANYFEISQELANDTPTNLLDFLARQAALSLGLGATGYGDDIINGVGTTEPRGLLLDAGTGVTGPTGTGTSLGTQGTANQGTDALYNLIGSVAEPYAASPSAAFLLRNASDIIVRKLKDTTGQPVQGLTTRGRILGYPSFVDPFMPAMVSGAESIAFGDMSKYFIRIVNGVRFERSDEFRFQNDLVAFRCILRLDGALIDTGAVKTFVNTT